jgi:DNA-binding response OmpR family regulator
MEAPPQLHSALIVTATAATQRMYSDYLTWRGLSVREVSSAAAARDYLTAFTPDVVVVEDRLDDGRGIDLVLALRRSRATSRLPIALLSTDVFEMTATRAKKFGCDLLLQVPCPPDTLYNALVQLVIDCAATHAISRPDSWLFVRGDESAMIVRTGDTELTVYGPGPEERVYPVASDLELFSFQTDYERRLLNQGFTFEAFRMDRRGHRDPSEWTEPERRREARTTSDTMRSVL